MKITSTKTVTSYTLELTPAEYDLMLLCTVSKAEALLAPARCSAASASDLDAVRGLRNALRDAREHKGG